MADQATYTRACLGEPADFEISSHNISDFVFGNPFLRSSRYIKHGPASASAHCLRNKVDPCKTAFIDGSTGAQIDHNTLRRDAFALAAGLQHRVNLRASPFWPGSREEAIISPVVLLHLPNCVPFVVLELGAWTAGLTVTAINWALRPPEIAAVIESCRPAILITSTSPEGLETVLQALQMLEDQDLAARYRSGKIFTVDVRAHSYDSMKKGLVKTSAIVSQSPTEPFAATEDWTVLLDYQSEAELPVYSESEESARRAAVILWSSGTSGKSKGVVLSHRAIVAAVQLLWYGNAEFGPNEVFIGFAPFFHIFGLLNIELLAIAMGATVVSMAKFEPKQYLQLAQSYRATHLHLAPPVAVILAKSPEVDEYNLSSVKSGTVGGAPLGPAVIGRIHDRLGFLVKMGYGLSETASVTSTLLRPWEEASRYLQSTGVPLPGVEIKVVATDGTDKVLARDEVGELLIMSPSLMNGYLNNPAATKDAFDRAGWFRTGDVGKIDKVGNVYITDRLKEVIKVKGFQVAPAELEGYLCAHPEVADAGVVSVYSEDDATEYPFAYIVPMDSDLRAASQTPGQMVNELNGYITNVLKFLEGKVVEYKWIKGGVVVTDSIPKSNAGKLLRREFKATIKGHFFQKYPPKRRPTSKARL